MNKHVCQICSSENSSELCRVGDYQILFCGQCQNSRTYPPPHDFDYTSEDFHGYNLETTSEPSSSFESLPEQWRESIQIQVALIKRNAHPGASILEIGCGEGILLHQLALSGFDVYGIEPGINASHRARKSGLNVTTGHYPEDSPRRQFDVVILSHVLEHLEKPGEILAKIATENPNAIILLVQTNFKGIIPRLRKEHWYAWAPEQHFWHFSTAGIIYLAHSHGYEARSVTYSSLCHLPILHRVLNLFAFFIPRLYDQIHVMISPRKEDAHRFDGHMQTKEP